mgnify:CR=1 FL=1
MTMLFSTEDHFQTLCYASGKIKHLGLILIIYSQNLAILLCCIFDFPLETVMIVPQFGSQLCENLLEKLPFLLGSTISISHPRG